MVSNVFGVIPSDFVVKKTLEHAIIGHHQDMPSVRGRGSFKVDWCCNFVTSCNRSNFYGSYESYECPLPYAIWQPDLLQGAAEVQTKIWRHIGRPRHTSKTHLKTTYQLDFSPDFYISR